MGYKYYGYLYPLTKGSQLYLKGNEEFGDYFDGDDEYIIAGVFPDRDDNEYYNSALEYLLVHVKRIKDKPSNNTDKPFLCRAEVVGRLKKENVIVNRKRADNLDARGVINFK
jgi:translation elongation factor EF-Tu-like GTPase